MGNGYPGMIYAGIYLGRNIISFCLNNAVAICFADLLFRLYRLPNFYIRFTKALRLFPIGFYRDLRMSREPKRRYLLPV